MFWTLSRLSRPILIIWAINCLLGIAIAIRQVWVPYMQAGKDAYSEIISDPFDGTSMPILYIPDWLKSWNTDKSKRFEDFPISDFMPIPSYDITALGNTDGSRASTILRYTYTTPYMGSYRMNYKENDGSHLGIDIRAPLGTPILSVANGVVVRVVQADATGCKFIVIRHDRVPSPTTGGTTTLYSSYLHLSETLVTEGTKVRKWDLIGRVGLTGITTTPHLHFQIDTIDAPFHPYFPFTSADSRSAGLSFFDSVSAGLGADLARKYTIHPMNWVQQYLNLSSLSVLPSSMQTTTVASSVTRVQPVTTVSTVTIPVAVPVAVPLSTFQATSTALPSGNQKCSAKRFSDISASSSFGKTLYRMIDSKCVFQNTGWVFAPQATVTQREALTFLMDYYGVKPMNSGKSQFLDIGMDDPLQGYALTAQKKNIFIGNYLYPNKLLSREDFIELLVKVAAPPRNPSQMKIYSDVENLNPKLQAIQDYAYMTRARGGNINPKWLLTRSDMVKLIANVKK